MKKLYVIAVGLVVVVAAVAGSLLDNKNVATAEEQVTSQKPARKAIERSRKTVQTLDNIFKQAIVLITDKYIHDEDDFAAGSAAVLLFENVSKSGPNKVRLLDATGEPYDTKNWLKTNSSGRALDA